MITDFSEVLKKRDKLLFAEINTHSEYGYLSTSIWNGATELQEMLWHTTRGKPIKELYNIINRIIIGEEFSFKNDEITSTFRLATDRDIVKANEDEIKFKKELNDIEIPPHIKKTEKAMLKRLGLDDDNN